MRRTFNYVFWFLVAGLVLSAAYTRRPHVRAALQSQPKPISYTVILQDYSQNAQASNASTYRITYAVRGDGSGVIEATSTEPGKSFSERIINFVSGKQMYIMEHDRRKSTTFNPNHKRQLPDPLNNCLVPGSETQQIAGEEKIDGYRAVRLAAGPATHWLALDYGCALIRDRAEWPDGQVSEKRLIALIPGEPSPMLFDDPATFEEVSPSRLFPESRDDAYYYSHRPKD